MSRHRQDDDQTAVFPAVPPAAAQTDMLVDATPSALAPSTIEELAESERADQRRSEHPWRSRIAAHRPAMLVAVLASVLVVGLTGWAIARPGQPSTQPIAATGAPVGAAGYVQAFGSLQASPSGSAIPGGKPAPRPSGSPSADASPSSDASPFSSSSSSSSQSPSPGPRLAAGAETVTRVSLRLVSTSDRHIYTADSYSRLEQVSSGSSQSRRSSATFTVVAGLADDKCFSLRSEDGLFLRHEDYRIRLHANDGSPLFRADATFCARSDDSTTGAVLLETHNYPGYYLHARGYDLWIDQWQDTTDFRRACSILPVTPLA